jgi:hypothetical protein
MTLMALIIGAFVKRKNKPSLFSIAVSQGIKDMFREMGYRSRK